MLFNNSFAIIKVAILMQTLTKKTRINIIILKQCQNVPLQIKKTLKFWYLMSLRQPDSVA